MQDYLEGVWGEAAARFRLLAENTAHPAAMTAPLLISFDVDCSADHAFTVWTSKIGTWWPSDHTVSGDPEEIVLEGYPGGRIYERTSTGERHEWGEVTTWEPPRRLSYRWHIGRAQRNGDRGRDQLHRRRCGAHAYRYRAQRVGRGG